MARTKANKAKYGLNIFTYEFDYTTDYPEGTQIELCTVPAGARFIKPLSGVDVHVAFNDGSTATLDIGTAGTADLYATDLALGTIAFVPFDTAVTQKVTTDTVLYFRPVSTNDGSAGSGTIQIAYEWRG